MKNEKQNRREFLQRSAAGVTVSLSLLKQLKAEEAQLDFAGTSAELNEITVGELQAKMNRGELSSRKIVEKYLARIREIDPKIHSVIEINPDALAIADRMDKERKRGKMRGALHGIPVLIKDNIDTADKMKTTAGSLALVNAPTPKHDAFLVQQLRKAGAVILGKANLSEWANFRSTKSISGWSGRGGQTNNPYILDKNPCGSSAGTGAAISANLAAVGVGTETNGSIICPALRCGLVGIKPTLGLVSRSGVIPISHSQDTAGTMTRTVADAAILLGVLVGADKSDSITAQAANGKKDYTKFLDKNGLRGARIGVARQFFDNNAKIKAVVEPHLQNLKNGGATLIDVSFPVIANFGDDETKVLQFEFKAGLNEYLARRNSQYKTLADLIKFNEDNKTKEMPLFGQEIFLASEKRSDLNDSSYLQSLQRLKLATQANGIDAIIGKNKLDAIVSPTVGSTWSLAAVAGYPYITVPAGIIDGLPAGIAFFGGAFSEPQLIKFAYAFEQMTRMRQEPKFLPTNR
ncbi:MAG: amidase [Acidobacteria bacterium]|jgi:amidase|nr:amidase [Acidobacteriota bacterium]